MSFENHCVIKSVVYIFISTVSEGVTDGSLHYTVVLHTVERVSAGYNML